MKKLAIFFLILFPVIVSAQENHIDANGMRQGLWKKTQANGRLLYEGNFRDDKPVGEWKRFHTGGQVKAIISYQEISDTAFTQLFDVWGKKVAEGNYVNEKKEGTWILFSDNNKIAEEQYLNGQPHGVFRKYYETGELLEEADWEFGKQEGDYQVFYKNGEPYMQCKFSNNLRNGLCLSYFQNGRMEMEAYYKNSLRDDEWKFFNEQGEFLYSLKYNEGQLLNPEVKDSIDNLQLQILENEKNSILDPEKFLQDPSEYMIQQGILK